MGRLRSGLAHGAARVFLRGIRWDFDSAPPELPRYVLIGAPHTSWFDFPMLIAALAQFDLPLEWMAKDSLFRPPFGALMRALGGIPVDRTQRRNAVMQAVELFRARERFVLAIAPEGTRKRTEGWKTGFWHIANQAGVPIVPGYVDGARRRAGFGPPLTPSGDIHADFERLAEFYRTVVPLHPDRFGPVRARPDARTNTAAAAATGGSGADLGANVEELGKEREIEGALQEGDAG